MKRLLVLGVLTLAMGCGGEEGGPDRCASVSEFGSRLCDLLEAPPIEYCGCWSGDVRAARGGVEWVASSDFPTVCFADPNEWSITYRVAAADLRGEAAALIADATEACGMEAHAVVRPVSPTAVGAGDGAYLVSTQCGAIFAPLVVSGFCLIDGQPIF